MGNAACVIEVRYAKGAAIRNVQIQFLEDYKDWKRGDRIITPVRKCWRKRRAKRRKPLSLPVFFWGGFLKGKKSKTKKFKVRVPLERIVNACLEILYFNEKVEKVRITIKKNSNQDIRLSCTGRGKLTARIRKDVAEVWVTGTDEELVSWEQFFTDFVTVPEFRLAEYIKWTKAET